MNMIKIEIIKLRGSSKLSKANTEDSGYDIAASLQGTKSVHVDPGRWISIDTGIILKLPPGIEAQIRPRSGLALKHGVTILNAPGTIDPGYRGEIKILLINHGTKRFFINDGDRIAQLCFSRILEVQFQELDINEKVSMDFIDSRQTQGLGSSGIS